MGRGFFAYYMAILPVPAPFWIPAFAGVTVGRAGSQELVSRVVAGVYSHSNRSSRLAAAHQGMKNRGTGWRAFCTGAWE